MKKIIFACLTFLSINVFALPISIPVTEDMVSSQISKAFPRIVKKIELSNPRIVFLDNKSLLCMDGVPKIMFLDKPFKFCAYFKPVWDEKEVQLNATDLQLSDMNIDGVGVINGGVKLLLNEVLPNIAPIKLYKSDSWLLKQISSIEVSDGVMYLKF